jgi:hypothetical protein
MPKVVFRKRETFLSIGGLLVTTGGVLIALSTRSAWSLYVGCSLSLIGIALLAYGTFGIARAGTRVIDEWNSEVLHRSLREAAPGSTIRVLQTSIPDATRFIGLLEDLLVHKNKQFRLRILLLDYETAHELLAARVKLRVETAEIHVAEVRAAVDQLIRLKQRVDADWKESKSGARLDLQIRLYSFLPFGSVFQIGDEQFFSGLFWNWTSSVNGPMIAVTDRASRTWKCFERHLTDGWADARPVYPPPDTAVQKGE